MRESSTSDARLVALNQTGLLGSNPEEAFDRLTRLATRSLGVPVALVSLVDEHRQFFKSCIGLPEPWATSRETPLSHSFCQHVVQSAEPLIIRDARLHPLVKDNLAVSEIGVVAYAGFPLVTEEGHVLGSFCAIDTKPRDWSANDLNILRDLTASTLSEIGLKQERDAARAASRSKDRFLAVLSHELRTPLSPVLMIADALSADEDLSSQVRDDARTILRNIQLQTRLIDDLLDMTRIENGKLSLTIQTLDLHAVLLDTVRLCEAETLKKGIAVELEIEAGRHGVKGDPVRLHQIFTNLLRNAVKFTPTGGRVVIHCSDLEKEFVAVTVKDNGIGIEPANLPKMFDAFEQGSRAITDEFSGLGLGLAITKALVEAHAGRITASSEGAGRGTSVTVELPAFQSTIAPKTETPAKSSPLPAVAPRLRILLVDDHHDTLRAMSRLLRRLEHKVTTADCVTAALAFAETESFDVLISDIGLPDGTGLDLMRELLKKRPIRGIALTGYGMDSDIFQTREAGYVAHLTKPINFQQLEAVLTDINGVTTFATPA